jgi:hypothetical protein
MRRGRALAEQTVIADQLIAVHTGVHVHVQILGRVVSHVVGATHDGSLSRSPHRYQPRSGDGGHDLVLTFAGREI